MTAKSQKLSRIEKSPERVNIAVRKLQEFQEGITTQGESIVQTTDSDDMFQNVLGVNTTSWTPALTFGGGSTGLTYGTQVGRYVQIGPVVFLWATIVLTAKGSSTGVASIGGVPSAATTVTGLEYVGTMQVITNMNLYTSADAGCRITSGASAVTLWDYDASTSKDGEQMTQAWFTNTSAFAIQIQYLTG